MNNTIRYNWLIATALVIWLLYMLAPILTPFIAAGLLAYIGDPMADRLQQWKFPRTLAVVTVFLVTFVIVGLLVLLVLPLIRTQVGSLFAALPGIIAGIEEVWLPRLSGVLDIPTGEDVGFSAFIARYSDMATSWGSALLMSLTRSGSAVVSAVISLFLVPILTFYLLRDWDWIVSHIGSIVPASQRDTVFELARETDEVLGAFLRGQLMVMFALSVMYVTGLSLVGLEYAFAIGVVAGLVSFVPYLGFVFGIGLASLTVFALPNPLLSLIGVIATFSVAQFIEGSILTPKLVGDRIGLHPVIVIFAIAAGGQLFGFFGILLALPAAAVLSVMVRFAYGRYLAEHPEAAAEIPAASEE